jgi:hypothetical protein
MPHANSVTIDHFRPAMRGPFGTTALFWCLIAGAVVDVIGGLYLVLWTNNVLALTGVPEALYSQLAFWPRYVAVFLFVLPVFYSFAAFDPSRYVGNVWGAVFGRVLGASFYVMYWMVGGAAVLFLMAGLMNLAFALYYGLALARSYSSTPVRA